MVDQQYIFKITEVVKVTDGDTYWLRVDVGFRGTLLINVRLMGYDCPEAHKGSEFEKDEAIEARDAATEFLSPFSLVSDQLWIQTTKDPDDFGRWLGDIWLETETAGRVHLGVRLRSLGLASVWPTRWRDEFDPDINAEDLIAEPLQVAGQPVHQGPRGIKLTHKPTDLVIVSLNGATQLENKARALNELKRRLRQQP